jgi:hypothetical protein
MSQLPLSHAPVTTEERYAYLVELVLKNGAIVSDERPFRLTRNEATEFLEEYNTDRLNWATLAKSYEDEEGEKELKFMEQALEIVESSALEFLEQHISENDLYLWGPEQ